MLCHVLTLFFCILTWNNVFAQNDCETIAGPIFRYPNFGELDPSETAIVGSKDKIKCKFLFSDLDSESI
jgi:hypothetical protein